MTKFLNDTGLGTLISLIKGEINDKKSIYIGTSPSGDAAKKDKTATVDTFPTVTENNVTKPKTGTIVGIKFLATNTYKTVNSTYTLNVNSTGAYPMYYNNAELATSTSANTLVAGYKNRYCYYIFNGTQWVWLGAGYDSNTTYSSMTQAEVTAGTGTTARIVTPKLLRDNFYTEGEVDEKLPLVVNFTESNDVVTCDTSIADIYAAFSAGREVFGRYNAEGQLNLTLCAYGVVTFSNAFGNNITQVIGFAEGNTDTWTNGSVTLQTQLTFDSTPTLGSSRPVTSEGIKVALNAKQDTLVSGTNIKTVQGYSLLGDGNVELDSNDISFNGTCTHASVGDSLEDAVVSLSNAINNKQNKDFIVTINQSGSVISSDKTLSQIIAAYNEGRNVIAKQGNGLYALNSISSGQAKFICSNPNEQNIWEIVVNSDNSCELNEYIWQPSLTFDSTPTASSSNPVTSDGVYTALQGKKDKDFVVTVTTTGSGSSVTYSANKTPVECYTAYNAGKKVIFKFNGSDLVLDYAFNSESNYQLVAHSIYDTNSKERLYTLRYVLYSGTTSLSISGYYLQSELTFDNTPTANSDNPVKSSGIKTALDAKQDKDFIITLSVNNGVYTADKSYSEVLAAYNAGKTPVVLYYEYICNFVSYDGSDFHFINHPYDELSVLYQATLHSNNTWEYSGLGLQEDLIFDNTPTANSTKPVTSSGIKSALDGKQDSLVSGTNIKTVNGTSLLGSGDLAVVSVDAGNINVLQSTGDSQVDVMSQKAVTDNIERVGGIFETAAKYGIDCTLPSGYTEVEWISNTGGGSAINTGLLPTDSNWRFISSWARISSSSLYYTNIVYAYNLTTDNAYNIRTNSNNTDKIEVVAYSRLASPTIVTLQSSSTNVWHYYDLRYGMLTLDGEEIPLATTAGTTENTRTLYLLPSTSYVQKIGAFLALHNGLPQAFLIPCVNSSNVAGMYDVVRRIWYESTNSTAYTTGTPLNISSSNKLVNAVSLSSANTLNFIEQEEGSSLDKVMSQKATTDGLNSIRANYLQGRLALFELADYPDLDPRTADGISVVFVTNKNNNNRTPMFAIWNPSNGSNNGFSSPNFSLARWDSWIKWGCVTNLFTVQTGGYSLSSPSNAHNVLTYDFKTGIAKYYKNGVLSFTSDAPSNYSEQDLRTYFATCTHIGLWAPPKGGEFKTNGYAVFGSVLSDDDVAAIYATGNSSIREHLIPVEQKANRLCPLIITNWGISKEYGTYTAVSGGGYTITPQSGTSVINFGFTGISGVKNNCIYEWDFEITSGTLGTSGTYNRKYAVGGAYSSAFVIYNSSGVDVTTETLSEGSYHVICKPNNIAAGSVNASYNNLWYRFGDASSDFSMTIQPNLKITERGAGLECSIDTYRGNCWELENGTKMPLHPSTYIYNTSSFSVGYDTYLEDVVIYSSSTLPQFNGQMAIDTTNGKVYIGYLTGSGGTWKQINNS